MRNFLLIFAALAGALVQQATANPLAHFHTNGTITLSGNVRHLDVRGDETSSREITATVDLHISDNGNFKFSVGAGGFVITVTKSTTPFSFMLAHIHQVPWKLASFNGIMAMRETIAEPHFIELHSGHAIETFKSLRVAFSGDTVRRIHITLVKTDGSSYRINLHMPAL